MFYHTPDSFQSRENEHYIRNATVQSQPHFCNLAAPRFCALRRHRYECKRRFLRICTPLSTNISLPIYITTYYLYVLHSHRGTLVHHAGTIRLTKSAARRNSHISIRALAKASYIYQSCVRTSGEYIVTYSRTRRRPAVVQRVNTSRVHAARVNNGEFVKRRSICAALERAEVVANLILPWNCVTSRRAAPIAFGRLVVAADNDAEGDKSKKDRQRCALTSL